MSKYTRTPGALLAVIGALAVLPASAPAQAQQVASATSTATGGMSYNSTNAATTIRISLSNGKFTIDDAVPIQAKDGCTPFPGDTTKVTCTAFKETPSRFKLFKISALGGADTVENNTVKTDGVGAPMNVSGGDGDDTLVGADKVADDLRGGPGNDELRGGNDTIVPNRDHLNGGAGIDNLIGGDSADELSGGPDNDKLDGGDGGDLLNGGGGNDTIDGGTVDSVGFHGADVVTYASSSQPVEVDLTRSSGHGQTNENDTILRVESVIGGQSDDLLIGDNNPNQLHGLEGDDTVKGNGGVDILTGGAGGDVLVPSPTDSIFVLPDGVFDGMDCGGSGDDSGEPGDLAFTVLADGDLANDCPAVIKI